MEIAKIHRVELREVWPHEAHDFTRWLEDNLDVLSESLAVGLDPESVRREASAGSFNVDLVVDDENGDTVIIENQLGRSDHDHLGKVLTYLVAFDAATAVWIVGVARPEHVTAISWLNDSTPITAYLFKIEAIQIGDSPAAPLLTRIVGPSEDSKQIASSKRDKSVRDTSRRSFFGQLLAQASTKTQLHSGRTAPSGPYLGGASGQPGVQFTYGVTKHGTSAILWIDRGPESDAWNAAFYDALRDRRDEIEATVGRPIEWQAKEGNRSRKLIVSIEEGGWMDPDTWDNVIEATVGTMLQLEASVRPHLTKLAQIADRASAT